MMNHIEKLVEATKDLSVSYRQAYNNGPDIGVRGYNVQENGRNIGYAGCTKDIIVIDGVSWLIAGDIWTTLEESHEEGREGSRVTSLLYMYCADLKFLKVNVQASAAICGTIVTVDLGTREVAERYELNDAHEGVLVLKPKN